MLLLQPGVNRAGLDLDRGVCRSHGSTVVSAPRIAAISHDFFTKNRVKTALRAGLAVFDQSLVKRLRIRNALPGRRPVFDQTFGKSLVNSLRVRCALGVGLAIYFFIDGNDVWGGWTL